MNAVFNELQEYVDYVENNIVLAKKRNRKNFATFETKFAMPVTQKSILKKQDMKLEFMNVNPVNFLI